jgi:hypothetical protein
MKNSSLKDIKFLLDKIVKKTELLSEKGSDLSQIEIDIILSDLRDLYQYFSQLNINSIDREEIIKTEEINKTEIENKDDSETHIPDILIKKETDEIKAIQNKVKETIDDLFNSSDTVTIADRFKDDKKSINDKIGQRKHEISIAEKLKHEQKGDIKELIGIKEKFMFINELFDGNMNEYNEFVKNMNSLSNSSEARTFIDDMKTKKNWNANLSSLSKLSDIIDNRYK